MKDTTYGFFLGPHASPLADEMLFERSVGMCE